MEKFEDVAAVIREYKDIIRTEKIASYVLHISKGKFFACF